MAVKIVVTWTARMKTKLGLNNTVASYLGALSLLIITVLSRCADLRAARRSEVAHLTTTKRHRKDSEKSGEGQATQKRGSQSLDSRGGGASVSRSQAPVRLGEGTIARSA